MTETAPQPTEAQTQKVILEYLQGIKHYFCWRNNTGVMNTPSVGNAKSRFIRFGKVGSGDILGMTHSGRFFSVEVKRKGNKPTDFQMEFMNRVKQEGGIALIAYSLDDVIAAGL